MSGRSLSCSLVDISFDAPAACTSWSCHQETSRGCIVYFGIFVDTTHVWTVKIVGQAGACRNTHEMEKVTPAQHAVKWQGCPPGGWEGWLEYAAGAMPRSRRSWTCCAIMLHNTPLFSLSLSFCMFFVIRRFDGRTLDGALFFCPVCAEPGYFGFVGCCFFYIQNTRRSSLSPAPPPRTRASVLSHDIHYL